MIFSVDIEKNFTMFFHLKIKEEGNSLLLDTLFWDLWRPAEKGFLSLDLKVLAENRGRAVHLGKTETSAGRLEDLLFQTPQDPEGEYLQDGDNTVTVYDVSF